LEDRLTPSGVDLSSSYGSLPLSFEVNQGQAAAGIDFVAHGQGYAIALTPAAALLGLPSGSAASTSALRLELLGGNAAASAQGLDLLPGVSNYLVGSDPSQWHTNIPTYGQVAYHDVYPGVDVIYHGGQQQLEYDFVLAAGADPNAIRLRFDGAEGLSLDGSGDLVVHAAEGDLVEQAPVLYQDGPDGRQAVSGGYVLDGGDEAHFQVGAYDAARLLVIDPVLVYSTYLGGSSDDRGNGIAVDGAGDAYVTGQTFSTNFPVTPAASFVRLLALHQRVDGQSDRIPAIACAGPFFRLQRRRRPPRMRKYESEPPRDVGLRRARPTPTQLGVARCPFRAGCSAVAVRAGVSDLAPRPIRPAGGASPGWRRWRTAPPRRSSRSVAATRRT
jgi:hypothetical protein